MKKILLLLFLLVLKSFAVCPGGSTIYAVPSSYATITLAEANLPANLSGLGIQCIDVDAGVYVESFQITGSINPSSSDYVVLTYSSSSDFHQADTSLGVKLRPTGNVNFDIAIAYTAVDGIDFKSAVNSFVVRLNASDIMFKNNIVINSYSPTGNKRGVLMNNDNCTMSNNIIIAEGMSGGTSLNYGIATLNTANQVNNNNFIGWPTCFQSFGSGAVFKNNVCESYEADGQVCESGVGTFDYNACGPCGSGTCAGANSLNNVTSAQFAFEDSSSFKFKTTSNYLNGKGQTIAGYSSDIFGATVEDPPQIGINFFVAGGAGGSSSDCANAALFRMGLAPCRR